jgi:YHS domain-containing protein
MKKSIALIIAASVATAAFAGPKADPVKPLPKTIHCAVMKTEVVNVAEATKNKSFADYKGRRYYFCCTMCPTSFKKAPAKFAKSESTPIPKAHA